LPLYDYQCQTCQAVTEVRHGFREVHDAPCPKCGGPLARVFNAAGIVFKGSGFYITDSRSGGSSGESGSSAGEPAKSQPAKSEPAKKADAPAA
jgi:putative FmdB family regulatory protein